MIFAKIVVKGDYQEKGDLVFRPLVRAYKEIGANSLIEGESAILLGVVDKNGVFHECFTREIINYSKYEELNNSDDQKYLGNLSQEQVSLLSSRIKELLFNERKIDYSDVKKAMEEDANDRSIEKKAYDDGLSMVNPYDKENPNGYKNFLFKCALLEEFNKNKSMCKSK